MERIDISNQPLREAHQRLFPSAMAFAERLGVSYNTYISHEKGERGMDLDTVEPYAAALRVSSGCLALLSAAPSVGKIASVLLAAPAGETGPAVERRRMAGAPLSSIWQAPLPRCTAS